MINGFELDRHSPVPDSPIAMSNETIVKVKKEKKEKKERKEKKHGALG